jgi:molybdopterin-guanine dinucleotide biosynthesis protein A
MNALLGIFIGGRGLRMGGVQKALLIAPDTGETLIARSLRIAREAELEVVLLGAAELGAQAAGALQLPDASSGIGPLAGLQSLLKHAGERNAICLACDMPYVTAELLGRLARASASKQPQVLAPRNPKTGKWEPLFARYQSPTVAPLLADALAEGERSFQGLFRRLTVAELPFDPSERAQLRDWDTPEDMREDD